MTEPEFVLLDEPAPAAGELTVRPLERAGRRGAHKSVLIRVDGHPPRRRRRLLLLAVLAIGAGAAAFVIMRRRRTQDQPPLTLLEDEDEVLAMREPPISAV